ncbi:cyclin-dependent kinase inhibitor 1B-like [Pollicipes pollicipes]|uniref:cyclin-dependent kinase inhibitor 1B-like n=1 Tax=Pollicipes pollicipes TaxID=41117 RepID=UPI001884A1DA|nr:cyclin-dependent kinase inhibitor 1B-like [Pollicipes pollicipes]
MLVMEEIVPEGGVRGEVVAHPALGQAARPPPSCRRRLFAATCPDSDSRLLRDELQAIYERQRLRWNFDFEREEPLPGRYQWEYVGGDRQRAFPTGRKAGRGPLQPLTSPRRLLLRPPWPI